MTINRIANTKFLIRAIAIAVPLAALLIVHARAQSSDPPAPSADQLPLAEIEVRRLAPLLKLEAGMTVADVGAGLGAWSLRLSQLIGSSEHVYATDIGEEQLAALRALAAREKLTNMSIIKGANSSTNLPARSPEGVPSGFPRRWADRSS